MFPKYFLVILTVFVQSKCDSNKIELIKSYAPFVSQPTNRNYSVTLQLSLNVTTRKDKLDGQNDYTFWNYDNTVPGPFIRTRVGDTLEATLSNYGQASHGIDFHAASGPGGGENIMLTAPNSSRKASFKMLCPGIYVYHCGSPPVPTHLANGLYGLILVEGPNPLPPVDEEYYIVKSEFYTEPASNNFLQMSAQNGLAEIPQFVVFNGRTKSLMEEPLKAKVNDWIRIFVGNAGPNQILSFHIIGVIFNRVYKEGDLVSEPAKNIQTTLIPAGGAAVVEFQVFVPGNYLIVDHSIFRINKGALGLLVVEGPPRPDIYCEFENDSCSGNGSNQRDITSATSATAEPSPTPKEPTPTPKGKNDVGRLFFQFNLLFISVGSILKRF